MSVFTNMTSATRAALLYITVGSITIVWAGMYYVYLNNHPAADHNDTPWYWCTGFLLTGVAVLLIGLMVGWIGRSARQAEQPHAVVAAADSAGNPVPSVVPLANNGAIPTAVPAPPPVITPAMRQNVVRS